MPFRTIIDFNTCIDQIQIKFYGNDVVFTSNLVEICDPPFEKVKRIDCGKGVDILQKIEESEGKIVLFLQKRFVFQNVILL